MSRSSKFDKKAKQWCREMMCVLPVFSEDHYRQMTDVERYIWDVAWLISEVVNGGFDQFFFNGSGDHALETLEALRTIGALETYELLRKACSFFPGGMPEKIQEERQLQLRAIRGDEPFPEFERLDELFYSRTEDLPLLLHRKWQKEKPGFLRD